MQLRFGSWSYEYRSNHECVTGVMKIPSLISKQRWNSRYRANVNVQQVGIK